MPFPSGGKRVRKWVAALIFIFFGLYSLYENMPKEVLTVPVILASPGPITLLIIIIGRGEIRSLKTAPSPGNKR
jgi:hypothetical protein